MRQHGLNRIGEDLSERLDIAQLDASINVLTDGDGTRSGALDDASGVRGC